MILCVLTVFFYNKHFLYYSALEILVFTNLYSGQIYTALFLSSILFILLLMENRLATRPRVIIYLALEIVKLALVIPYGAKNFFEYIGITLFSLCTIGCINILFRHAYDSQPERLQTFRPPEGLHKRNCRKQHNN